MTGAAAVRPPPFGVTTVLMCLLFGTNFFLYILFQMIKNSPKQSDQLAKKDKKEKELSKPFIGTLECYANLTQELFLTGLVMAMTYICEYCWFFAHSSKSYSRDLFMFVLIVFFAYAWYTLHPVKDLSLLGREQTEEWKGWMQFIFLLYHYFHAEEVYNSVRVMITCYVWMTGYGNFSFFYIKGDFGWLRVVQMLWRLNFSVILLMWTHGNTYILYYICPMHTFYFLMVYTTMFLFQNLNATKWGIRWKLLVLALIIFVVWDYNNGIFDILFAWLGTDKVIGANSGSVYEYYFRTSLDHWSTFLGMIFALNYPLADQYFTRARGWPLWIAAAVMGSLTIYWLYNYFPLAKLEYNLTHSYFSIIPLTSYIFFRNITPYLRSWVSMSLHDLGKTTLETYLLQHHIWLSSNAKTLWTIIPGNPWINFALATIIFFAVSKELYRITMSLRGMILPDDKNIAWRNMWGTIVLVSVLGLIAHMLISFDPSAVEILIVCEGLCLVAVFLISRFSPSLAEQSSFDHYASRFYKYMGALFFGSLLLHLVWGKQAFAGTSTDLVVKPAYRGNSQECLAAVSRGAWQSLPCASDIPALKTNVAAFCEQDMWTWSDLPPQCPVTKLSVSKANAVFKGKNVLFVGDSVVRSSYHQFISLLEPKYQQNHSFALKHQDFQYRVSSSDCTVTFVWAPFVTDVGKVLQEKSVQAQLVVAGASLWDALHKHSVTNYASALEALATSLPPSIRGVNQTTTVKLWLLPTDVFDERLPTPEKREHMNHQQVEAHRQVVEQNKAMQEVFHTFVDPKSVSSGREGSSTDGVHYADEVYDVVAQMLANAYALHFPSNYGKNSLNNKPYQPKATGAMSNPFYGACMLVLIVVMLFTMDSWFGIGWITLALGGQSYDWDLAYSPYLRKINQQNNNHHSPAPASAATGHSSSSSTNAVSGSGERHEADEIELLLQSNREDDGSKA